MTGLTVLLENWEDIFIEGRRGGCGSARARTLRGRFSAW